MILAEASNSDIGSFINVLSILIGIVGGAFGIYFGLRKRHVHIEPQPVEVTKSPKRYNHDRTEQRFVDHERRLDEHGEAIESIWTTMRAEDAKIREDNNTQFRLIAKSLGRIEGRLDVKPPTEI